jgi:hypothetical protein
MEKDLHGDLEMMEENFDLCDMQLKSKGKIQLILMEMHANEE